MTTPEGDVRQVIETEAPGRVNAAPELKVAGERWPWQEFDNMLGDITAILDEHALNGSTHLHMLRWKIRALTAHPAPSGWQQRIAAMEPWTFGDGKECVFCRADGNNIELGIAQHASTCLWQNAVDALPPALEVKDTADYPPSERMLASSLSARRVIDAGSQVCGSCGHSRSLHLDRGGGRCNDRGCECSGWIDGGPDAKDALPPVPEGATAKPRGASKTLVIRNYYAGRDTTYHSCFHTHADKSLGHYEEIDRLVEAAKVQDGDEVVIEIRPTGLRPFGDRRYILKAPHTYAPETDEQMRERLAEADASPVKEERDGE